MIAVRSWEVAQRKNVSGFMWTPQQSVTFAELRKAYA
jgi:hypothetical protein